MGIKDWFGGDKKKAAYREKLKEAVSGGRLGSKDMKELEKLRKDLDVPNAAEDRTVMRREIYNEAVDAVRRERSLSGTGVHELQKIQKFLALRDDQIEKTRWDLAKLRTLTEIRHGNLPMVPPNNAALRGVELEPGEIPHYSMSVEMLDLPTTRQNDGLRMEFGAIYEQGAAQMHVLPEDGSKPQGDASVIITNRRLIVKAPSGKTAAVRYTPQAQIALYGDGIRLERTVGNTVLRFKSKSPETSEIVGELLSAVMR